MTLSEFSDSFDVLVNSLGGTYMQTSDSSRDLAFNEYEKSVFLTKAQYEIVISFYSGNNTVNNFFEGTEEMRRYLDGLVRTKKYSVPNDEMEDPNNTLIAVSDNSVFFELPEDIAFITMEQIVYNDNALCKNSIRANVYPIKQDEFSRVKDNPFRGPTRYKALRLDYGENIVEIIPKYAISEYIVRYLSKPTPIILVDLPAELSIEGEHEATDCKLNPLLHDTILERAVYLALASKNINITKDTK